MYNTLGFCPKNLQWYKQCFIHRSSSKVQTIGSNERLEYLGDAILDSIVADYLFSKYPEEQEGHLTEMRAKIVNRQNMNKIGLELQLQRHILARIPNLSKNDAIGNCLEALIGAIYEDQGYKKARKFVIEKLILPHINDKVQNKHETNYKSLLLQQCQHNKLSLEFLTEESQNSTARQRQFTCTIQIDGKVISQANGRSKKVAEQSSARIALSKKSTISIKEE